MPFPRIQRPLWVAEQLEVALFEGLARRVSAAIRRITARRAREEPDEYGPIQMVRWLKKASVTVALVTAGISTVIAGFAKSPWISVLGLIIAVMSVLLIRSTLNTRARRRQTK
jgi:phosphoserine phosphatase